MRNRTGKQFNSHRRNRKKRSGRRLFLESLDTRLVLSGSPLLMESGEADIVAESLDQQPALMLLQGEGEGTVATSRLTIFANRQQVTIPANIGVKADSSKANVFTSTADGSLQSMTANTKLGDFFNTWRTDAGLAGNKSDAVLSATQLLSNVADTSHTVQMFVNGQISEEFGNHVLQNGEEIVLVYSNDPVVSLNTNFGPIVVELFEQQTPGTVNNFLKYVNDGDYINSFFHRSANNSDGTDFVIQGGGFKTTSPTFTSTAQFSSVPTDPPIQNEPGISNVRGTVAMAKTSDPNSATSQFFVNLNNSNTFLDSTTNSGGFTVFGHVLDLHSSDTIAALPTRANPSPYAELPVSTSNQLVVLQSIVGRGEISGIRFNDANSNGLRDSGETASAGATMFLDTNNNGVLDSGERSTLTDASGRYLFQVDPGSYTVRTQLGSASTVTTPAAPGSYAVTVQIGREVTSRDFGVATVVDANTNNSLSGFVYLDADQSGTRATGEVGVPGAQITLTGAGITRTILTNANGAYSFVDLPAGTYELVERQPMALLDRTESTTVPNAVVGNDRITTIALNGGQNFAENNFGELGIQSQYLTIAWYFASSSTPTTMFRETIAVAEEMAGHLTLATTIRAGGTEVPTGSNTAPIAIGDAYSVNRNGVLTVALASGVLKNDTDANGDSLTATVRTQPARGTLSFNTNGTFTYTPTSNFFGTDSFTYQASDGTASSNNATVTFTVNEANASTPVAVADSYSVNKNSTLTVARALGVLKNDTDADGDSLTAQRVAAPSQWNAVAERRRLVHLYAEHQFRR